MDVGLQGMVGDLRYGVRALTRSRGFGVVAVLVLAASVAINTLIFFMLDGVVLRPLPYASPEQLVRLYDATARTPKFPMSIAHYLDYREHARSLAGIALYTGKDVELGGDRGSRQLTGVQITSEYFSVLGRAPLLGRAFVEADLRGGVRSVILSARLWREQFHGDPAIVGKTIRLNREASTIVGVAPDGLQHVGGDYRSPLQGESVDVWLPLPLDLPSGARRFSHFCNAIARMRDGFTEAQVRDELARLAAAYRQRDPDAGAWTARLEPLLNEVTGRSRQVIWLLVAAGGLVLLVACANIAGLCVARASARRKELSLRRALGATRWQIVRVGLAENLVIGLAGGIVGLVIAGAGLPLLRQLLPVDFPRAHEIGLTPGSAAFAVIVALATVLIAGLLPSWSTGSIPSPLQRVTSGRESRRLRTTLVVAEVALAGLLCAGASFLLRSYQEIGVRDHGFTPAGALTFRVSLPFGDKPGEIWRLYDRMRSNISELPGVTAVGASTNLPWSGYDENAGFEVIGRTQADNRESSARYQAASPGYFEAARMHVISGRLFDRTRDAEGQPLTVIINDALAAREFPHGRAVGAKVGVFGKPREVIGVVAGIRDQPADPDIKPAFWLPLAQVEFPNVFFVVRTARVDPAALTSGVTAAVHAVDPELPLADIRTLERRSAGALASRRFALWLLQAFAILALALAATGLYGLLAYLVRQRRKELGIRLALGASGRDLWRMVLVDGLAMAAAGALVSALLIPLCGTVLGAFLYNVRPYDPITLIGAPVALLIVALIATLAPARAALRSDPAIALREE